MNAYGRALRELYAINLRNPVKLGLHNSEKLYELLGKPLNRIPTVHVGGTNGKGSVCVKVAECLKNAGLKTGLFVSPHISSFRERIQVDGMLIREETFSQGFAALTKLCDKRDIPATFFELTTALAFMKFQSSDCDVVVMEVGLGGKTDATNVITPAVSVITSVQLDHCKILGDTVEKIAIEKAGIMKRNVPIIVGPGVPQDIIVNEALRVGAPLYTIDSLVRKNERLWRPNGGYDDIDHLNTDIARAVINVLKKDGRLGYRLQTVTPRELTASLSIRPPCRFQRMDVVCNEKKIPVVLDIAHNVDALTCLAQKMKSVFPRHKVRVVFAMSSDKDVSNSVAAILPVTDPEYIHCTEV
jgi:dihydrofolate synthase/folylpolyglutamate synthase